MTMVAADAVPQLADLYCLTLVGLLKAHSLGAGAGFCPKSGNPPHEDLGKFFRRCDLSILLD